MVDVKNDTSRLAAWWRRQRRPVRRAVVGYVVVIVFAVTYVLARAIDSKLSSTGALIPAALVTAPLLIAFLGDRITGLKFMSVEVSLSEVKVEINDDVSDAIQKQGEESFSDYISEIEGRIVELIVQPNHTFILRVNLGDGTTWWSTRVFLLAALAADYTDLQQIVFVDNGERQHFIGLAVPMEVRWSLARRFPDYEAAYRMIRSDIAESDVIADKSTEVKNILQRWGSVWPGGEEAQKMFVNRRNLSEWLKDCLDPTSVEWDRGPLTPLVRYRINSLPNRYVAMTSNESLVDIIDRIALATDAERGLLEARLT